MKKSLTCFQHKWRNCLSNFEAARYFLHNKTDICFTCYTVNSAHRSNGTRVGNCVEITFANPTEWDCPVFLPSFYFTGHWRRNWRGKWHNIFVPPHPLPQKNQNITVLSHVLLSSFLFVVLAVWQIVSIKITNNLLLMSEIDATLATNSFHASSWWC